jgi:hypothetical protein
MKNPVFGGLAAANAGGEILAHPVGEHWTPRPAGAPRSNCAPATYQGTGVFAASAAAGISQRMTISKYQDMTRTDAAGGSVPGSHPVWDPV